MRNTVSFDRAKLVSVIEMTTTDGSGMQDDPVRSVKRYWDEDGRYIGQLVEGRDPLTSPNASWKAISESMK